VVASGAPNQVECDAARLATILAARGHLAGQLDRVEWVATTDSTNRVLADGLRAGERPGRVLVTDHQSAGRGRLGRVWEAPPRSALMMSFTLAPPLAAGMGLLPLAVGLGALDALDALGVPGVDGSPGGLGVHGPRRRVELKWPNDLMVGERKLAGILCEAVTGAGVVCGIGLNRVRPAMVEGVLAARAIWCDEIGPVPDPAELAAEVLDAALRWRGRAAASPPAFVAAFGERCATVGCDVRVELAAEVLTGTAVGVRDDGALLVAPADATATVAVTAGDVVHLRPVQDRARRGAGPAHATGR
jgi:BirA family biotin operon repressor/biotin-[acetyl-CoA-carboxylase] ligase